MTCWRNSRVLALLAGIVLWSACGASRRTEPVRLVATVTRGEPILTVVPVAGYRINGRVPPGLELSSGKVIRLNRGQQSPDSAYFLEQPWAPDPGWRPLVGTLRASVCRTDESLCRVALVPVALTAHEKE